MNVKFTDFTTVSNWVSGIVDNGKWKFQAKLFDEGSEFGINEGRISKLSIVPGHQIHWANEIVNYDRGWDLEPTEEYQQLFNEVVTFLENSPKRFN